MYISKYKSKGEQPAHSLPVMLSQWEIVELEALIHSFSQLLTQNSLQDLYLSIIHKRGNKFFFKIYQLFICTI